MQLSICSILTQKDWAYIPEAQDTNYVDVSDIKWRRGYGEDEDALERLQEKKIQP